MSTNKNIIKLYTFWVLKNYIPPNCIFFNVFYKPKSLYICQVPKIHTKLYGIRFLLLQYKTSSLRVKKTAWPVLKLEHNIEFLSFLVTQVEIKFRKQSN